jgi:hypothetical protein
MTLEELSFVDLIKEVDKELSTTHSGNSQDDFPMDLPIVDALDSQILMHRDSHFGGKFSIMLDYYEKDGKGVDPEIDLRRIHELMQHEEAYGKNLAAMMLTGPDAETVAKAKDFYKKLRSIYEVDSTQNPYPKLIADLILTEEEDAEEEIENIVSEGSPIVPSLIELLRKDEFLDPLFPGYGIAPLYAAECLGKIKDERAIRPLFEVLGKQSEELEMPAIDALRDIGGAAKDFLIRVLQSRPVTADNINGGMALGLGFLGDEEVASACFNQLKLLTSEKNSNFQKFLILACVGLKSDLRESFKSWSETVPSSLGLAAEFSAVFADWKDDE